MATRVSRTPPAPPSVASCVFGAPVRPETLLALAECVQHLAVVRTRRVVTHVIGHPTPDPYRTAPDGEQTHRTRWRLGALASTVVVGLRVQAARPKDGESAAAMVLTLRRTSDDEVIDATSLGPADIPTTPDDAPAFPARWLWLPVPGVGGPRALDASGYAGDDVELTVTATDVRVLTIVAHELDAREVG